MCLANYCIYNLCHLCRVLSISVSKMHDKNLTTYNHWILGSHQNDLWPSWRSSTRFEMFDPSMPKMWGAKVWVYCLRNGLWLANFYDKSDGHKPQFGSTKSRCSTSFLGAKWHPEYFILATQDRSAINSRDLHQDLCPDCFLQVHRQWTGSPG